MDSETSFGTFSKPSSLSTEEDMLDSSKLLPKKLNLWEEQHGIKTNHKEMPKYQKRNEMQISAVSKLANRQLRPDIPIKKSDSYHWNNSTILEEDNAVGLHRNL